MWAGPYLRRLRQVLPRGRTLPEDSWRLRHRALLALLWLHVPVVLGMTIAEGLSLGHGLVEVGMVTAGAAAATLVGERRRLAAPLVSLGLLTCSAVLIHIGGGFIELHFHFFVVVVALTLYEEWLPFGLAAGYVALHHAVLGTLTPETIFNHPDAQAHPVRWALIHAGFIAAAGLAAVAAWRLNEDVRDELTLALRRAQRAERAQARAREELERTNADLQQLSYAASHDLSEPLRTVAGFVGLLRQRYGGRLDADADEFIRYALDGTQRMQALIDDLLAFSRVGRVELRREQVDLGALARDVLAGLGGAIERAGARVEVGPLPTVQGDGRQLAQLLQNLLSNAVKFTDGGPPHVRVEAEREPDGWVVSVIDDGIGVDAAHAERIFAVFHRVHSRERYEGTGIGLAICERIVARHGGRIWVEPGPGWEGQRVPLLAAGSGVASLASCC
jgi:signal transduction histidine kinase